MLTFKCDSCGHILFFENVRCIRCGSWLGYSTEEQRILALEEVTVADGEGEQTFKPVAAQGGPTSYRFCKNTGLYNACNWLVDSRSSDEYCASCQLTEILPAMVDEATRQRWVRVETGKRRLLFTLNQLQLPVHSQKGEQLGLVFRFPQATKDHPVITGHASGVITLNIAEADHSFRENEREKLGEAYRTVLGHLRHEVGHYYWDLLVKDSDVWLPRIRALFGDDRESYQDAIKRHYAEGPPAEWRTNYISAYATMHPWEDWAETFAHYLHMVDTLETAQSYDLSVTSPSTQGTPQAVQMLASLEGLDLSNFDKIFDRWYALTFVLNGLSRSMGMPDTYPFAISDKVREKLQAVHELIKETREAPRAAPQASQPLPDTQSPSPGRALPEVEAAPSDPVKHA